MTKKLDIEYTATAYDVIYEDDPDMAQEMAAKAALVHQIEAIRKDRGLTQAQLADAISLDQSDVSRMLNGHFHGLALSRLMQCLTRLNRDVSIVVQKHEGSGKAGIAVATA